MTTPMFPLLSSGAVTQYPLLYGATQSTSAIQFLDGSDQRFRTRGQQLRSWEIRLTLLNDSEMQGLESFFVSQQGAYSLFTFPDPISGVEVPNCILSSSELVTSYQDLNSGSLSLWVMETNG